MLDLKANPDRKATGSIIESSLDKGRGYVATMLVANGTLKMGDIVLAGTSYGKVKAMFNERNQRIKEAGPSEPVLILGLNGAPAAGDTFHVIDTEQEARDIANKREQLQREQGLRTQKLLTLDEVGRRLALGDFHELNVIVKGDVDGSVEALSDSLIKLSTEQVQVNVIHKGVGQISESDVTLAAASDAIIVGFQVRPSSSAGKLAEQEGVDIRKYSVIYDAIEEVKAAMEGMLAPTLKEQITATIEVREVFNITKVGLVAGAMVKTGKVKRSDKARLIRDGIVVFTGAINALKRFKDDVKEVGTNFECGISLTNCNDIKVGDIIEAYEEVEVKQTCNILKSENIDGNVILSIAKDLHLAQRVGWQILRFVQNGITAFCNNDKDGDNRYYYIGYDWCGCHYGINKRICEADGVYCRVDSRIADGSCLVWHCC